MRPLLKAALACAASLCMFTACAGPAGSAAENTATATATATAGGDALYQDLGGKEGIRRLVEQFVPIMLADARVSASFKDVDLKALHTGLMLQFCEEAGGPCKFGGKGKDMATIHQDLKITNAQFNAVVEDLQVAMDSVGLASQIQNRLLAKLAPMQKDIVTK